MNKTIFWDPNMRYVLMTERKYVTPNMGEYADNPILAEVFDADYAIPYAATMESYQAIPLSEVFSDTEVIQRHIRRLEIMRDCLADNETEGAT